ncbi:MAG TPA: apolipoprotein N-acyltransferase [Nannocystis sp.]
MILESTPGSIQSVLRKISREPGPFGLNHRWDDLGPRRQLLARLGAAMLSAACMVLGSPDYDQWYLAFVGWIFWLGAIEGLAPARAFWIGWACGIVTVFFGFFWLTELLLRFADFPMWATLLVHLLFAAFQGLQWAAPAALVNWLRRRTGRDVLLLAPLCWVAGEALLPHLFPSYLALMWCWQPLWLQTAEIGGVTTIGLVQLLINAGFYVALRDWLAGRGVDRRALVVAGVTLVATPVYGAIRMAQVDAMIEAAPKVKVGVVQGNFGITEWGRGSLKFAILRKMQEESARLEAEGAELLLWGETAYPFSYALARGEATDLPEGNGRRVRRGFTAPLVFGVVTADRKVSEFPWNSARVLAPDGRLGDSYDKVYPLWFGEYTPLVDPHWFREKVPSASHINPGAGPKALRVWTGTSEQDSPWRLGPLICYEDILPRFARSVAGEGIHAFVNLTNDSWFGKSKEQYQHLGLAVLRTIENRRAMLRSVNAGVSAYIDPNGRLVKSLDSTNPDEEGPLPADGFVADVPMIDPDYRTLYTRTGELFNALVILTLAGLAIRGRRR